MASSPSRSTSATASMGSSSTPDRPGGFGEVDDDVLLALGNQAGSVLHHGRVNQELREAHRAVVRVLAEAVAARDPVLQRVAGAVDPGKPDRRRSRARRARPRRSRDRDTAAGRGLLGAPGTAVLERRSLSPDERSLIALHPRLGFECPRQPRPSASPRWPCSTTTSATTVMAIQRAPGAGHPAPRSRVERSRGVQRDDARTPAPSTRSSDEACAELIDNAGTQFDPRSSSSSSSGTRAGAGRRRAAGRSSSRASLSTGVTSRRSSTGSPSLATIARCSTPSGYGEVARPPLAASPSSCFSCRIFRASTRSWAMSPAID